MPRRRKAPETAPPAQPLVPAPQPAEPPPVKPAKRLIPLAERHKREQAIDLLLTQGKSQHVIINYCKQQFHQSSYTTLKMIERIKAQWATDAAADRITNRQAAVKRCYRYLDELTREPSSRKAALTSLYRKRYEDKALKAIMEGKEGPPPFDPSKDPMLQNELAGVKADYKSILEVEHLLSDLQGTKEPVQVNLNLTLQENLVHVIAGMSEDQMNAVLDKVTQAMELANEAQALGLLPRGIITAKAG